MRKGGIVEEAVFIKESEAGLFIRAQGHITAQLCPELKSRAFSRLDAEPPLKAIYIDFEAAEYMDSTFLGLLVGLNKRFKALSGRPITLLRVNATCGGLLRTIGVSKLVEMAEAGPDFPKIMERLGRGPRATAEFLLDAHEELTGLSEENRARFSTLTETLKSALGKDQKEEK